jgi:hypothetical protein
MQRIKVGKRFTIVDDDFDKDSFKKEYTLYINNTGYVMTCRRGTNDRIFLHRLILGLNKRDGNIVDHINRNRRDNRKENLRIVDYRANAANRKSFSKFRNINKNRKGGFDVNLFFDGKWYYGGYFKKFNEARKSANELRKRLHGEYYVAS